MLDLNVQIANSTAVGDAPNDLLDQRDVLVDRLAQLGNVSTTAGANGAIDVTFAGATLVTGTTSSATLAESDLTSLSSGKLAGLVNLRDTLLPGYKSAARRDRERDRHEDERLHHTGYDLNGIAGGDFFAAARHDRGHDRRRPRRSSRRPAKVAAAKAPGEYGDATVALAIGDLRDDSSIDVAYRQLVTTIGSDSQEAQRSLANATLLADALSSRRDSISGVSLDEEMTNLMTLPARLPGLVARAQRDGRDDRPARQPHRKGRAVSTAASRSRC